MTDIIFEGKPLKSIELHLVGKSLWAKLEFEDGKKFDIELERSKRHAIVEIGERGEEG